MEINIGKYLQQFFLEAQEKLGNVQNKMVEVEQNPHLKDGLLQIQRDMHTIKGSARMVGQKEISAMAHRMEDVFARLHASTTPLHAAVMNVLYRAVDALTGLIEAARQGGALPDTGAVEADLQQVLDGKIGESPAAAPAAEGGRKRFNLDFRALKRSVQQAPAPVAETPAAPPPAMRPVPATAEEIPAPAPRSDRPDCLPEASSAMLASEKRYLKVENERIEAIINQVTDLLSKKYFFTNVLVTFRRLAKIMDGFRDEWERFRDESWVDFGKLEGMNNIENILGLFNKSLMEFEREYQSNFATFEGALRDIFDGLLELKLTPLSSIFTIYPRFVRDFAHKSGKKIRIFLRGGDIQLDKTITERIGEPLIHIVRNACDHGAEPPEERQAAGKEATATIIIEANKKGNRVEIRISDDGRGLNREKILAAALQRKLVEPDKAAQMDDDDVFNLIFLPCFSTMEQVSDISGRGIGMDIVKKVMHQLNGSVRIETRPGRGTAFILEFPISIFTNKVMVIADEQKTYAIPSALIRRVVKLVPGDVRQNHDYSVVVHDGEIYTVSRLSQILGGVSSRLDERRQIYMILPKVTDKKIGILVDDIHHECEVIIKELGQFLGKRKYVYGIVIGEKGELQIVLDLHDVVESSEFSHRIRILKPPTAEGAPPVRSVLVVDDSMLVREMEKNVLENAGYQVLTAVNGLDGYNKAVSQKFDLILADIEMPEMDGFEMIEQIRKIPDYREIPVIVLSTREREEDKIRGIKVGANAWLQKQNFEDREFLRVVKSFIG